MSPPAAGSAASLRSASQSKNSALTDAWLRLAQGQAVPLLPLVVEPSLHPIFEALQKVPKETKQKPPRIRIADHYAFVLDKQTALQRSIWSNQATWPERVCRQALPDHFETDPTYLRVPGAQCPEQTCGGSSQVQGLWLPDQGRGGPLYVVHGCTQCGQRRLLARDAEVRVVYS